jgi:hypothetical protein
MQAVAASLASSSSAVLPRNTDGDDGVQHGAAASPTTAMPWQGYQWPSSSTNTMLLSQTVSEDLATPKRPAFENGDCVSRNAGSHVLRQHSSARELTRQIKRTNHWRQLSTLLASRASGLSDINAVHVAAILHHCSSTLERGADVCEMLGWLASVVLPHGCDLLAHGNARPRELATMLHALAVLGLPPHPTVLIAASWAVERHIKDFTPRDTASCLWSLARLLPRYLSAGGSVPLLHVSGATHGTTVQRATGLLLTHAVSCTPSSSSHAAANTQDLANVVTAAAKLYHIGLVPDSAYCCKGVDEGDVTQQTWLDQAWGTWVEQFCVVSMPLLSSGDARSLASISWGLASFRMRLAGFVPHGQIRSMLTAAAIPQLSDACPQALTALICSSDRLGWFADDCAWASELQTASLLAMPALGVRDLCDVGGAAAGLLCSADARALSNWSLAYESAVAARCALCAKVP